MWSPFKKEEPKSELPKQEQPKPEDAKQVVGDIFKSIDDSISFYKNALDNVRKIQKDQSDLLVLISRKLTEMEEKIRALDEKIKRMDTPSYIG